MQTLCYISKVMNSEYILYLLFNYHCCRLGCIFYCKLKTSEYEMFLLLLMIFIFRDPYIIQVFRFY